MRIEVLTVPDCPNGPVVLERLAVVLAGRPQVQVVEHVITEQAEAARRGMRGSPTVLIDGHDPFAGPDLPPSLSCRLYRDRKGRAQGAPSIEELRHATEGQVHSGKAAAADWAAGRGGQGRVAPVERGLRAVHQTILRSFAATGLAPAPPDLDGVPAAAGFAGSAADTLADLAAGDFLTLDHDGQIVAAYPFCAQPTSIRVQIADGTQVYSMCAIDALGIPAMLHRDVVIMSTDPVSGTPIRVHAHRGEFRWEPTRAVVFYGARDDSGPAAAVCCGYVRFFTDRAGAEQWATAHPEAPGTVLGQRDAERLGAEIFGPLLRQPLRHGACGHWRQMTPD
ncbi:MAG: alkylmercury lyase family protein [Streptosporangiaceae bacterium]